MALTNQRRRLAAVTLFLLTAALALACGPAASAAGDPDGVRRGGIVRDAIGAAIDGVEVLVFPVDRAFEPVARTVTDASGLFRLPELRPGPYRFAAIKDGYQSLVGRIDIDAEPWLDLILAPAPQSPAALALTPKDDAWIYRLPRRTGFRATGADASPADVTQPSALGDRVAMQLEHLMALLPGSNDDAPDGELSGAQTRLKLSSIVSDRTQVELAGLRESLDSRWGVEERQGAARDSQDWQVGVRYASSADSRLEMSAFFSDQEVAWGAGNAGGPREAGHRSWGAGSNWSMQLDPMSRVNVSLDYVDSTTLDPRAGALDADALLDVKGGWSTRALRASGQYRAASLSGHDLRLGLRAEMRELPIARASRGERLLLPEAVDNWRVMLDAEDSWSLSGPFTLVYGLGYRHAIDTVDTALIVPRVGGSMQLRPLALGVTFSYHADQRWEGAPLPVESPDLRDADDRVGYQAELALPLGAQVTLGASSRYEPLVVDDGYEVLRPGLDYEAPLFRSDGDVARREHRLTLTHDGTALRAYLELEQGRAVGWIDPVRPGELGFDLLTLAALDYERGRLGFEIVPSGTDLRIEYRRADEAQLETADAMALDALELRLLQDLLRFDALGRWRLLMAFRMESLKPLREPSGDELTERAMTAAMNRGVSAGLAVTF